MLDALAMLVSTVIGAGVLGLPRVFYETGLSSIPLLAIILSALYLLGLMILEMLDSEKKPIQLPALIASKIGEKWKRPVYLSLIFSMYGALTAYLIGFGEQMTVVLNISPLFGSLVLLALGTLMVFKGTNIIGKLDVPLTALMILFLIGISGYNFSQASYSLVTLPAKMSSIPLFLGTALFALYGHNILPEVKFLAKKKQKMVLILGQLICVLLYALFGLSTSMVLGPNTTEVGTKGLAMLYGGFADIGVSLFAMTALFTSFMGIGLAIRHIYNFDFGLSRIKSVLATVLPPVLIFSLSDKLKFGFLSLLGFAGEITLPIFSLITIHAYMKSGGRMNKLKIAYTGLVFVSIMVLALIGF